MRAEERLAAFLVSRAFSKLGEMGLIEVDRRYVRIASPADLSEMTKQ